ncbi:hypothetical protein Ddc_07521 [Ditylenchus destructor]|nr:hypothetical protein Ddc_07521 [Ditylenchus destructor]
MTVNPFVKVSQYLADLAASYNQGEGSASSRDSLFLHDSEENHVESILDDVISNPTDHTHSVHLRLSSQRRRMAQEKIAAVRNNPLKFVSLANSSFAAGNGLAYKAREQMSIVEQQKAVRAHLLQMVSIRTNKIAPMQMTRKKTTGRSTWNCGAVKESLPYYRVKRRKL